MRATDFVLRVRDEYDGWLIVGVMFLALALTIGTSSYAFGLFVEPLERTFGWQRTEISASLSFMAVGAISTPFLGRLMDRYGARPVMTVSLSIFGLSFLLRPLMSELWHWYALSLMQFISFSGAGVLPAGRLVGIWFKSRRGRVMGLTMMGNNFGGLTMPLVIGIALAAASWEAAFVVVAAIAFTIALLALILVHERPAYDRAGAGGSSATQRSTDAVLSGWTARDALRTREFYALTLAMMLGSFTYSSVLPHVSAHLAVEGMTAGGVIVALALLGAFGMMGKIGFGYLAERFTSRRAMMLSLGGQVLFITLMTSYPSPPLVWASVPMFGLCMGAYGVLATLIVQESFGLKHFGSITGLVNIPTILPSTVGPLMAGASFDIRGSYGPAFVATAVLFAIGIALLTQVRRPLIWEQV